MIFLRERDKAIELEREREREREREILHQKTLRTLRVFMDRELY